MGFEFALEVVEAQLSIFGIGFDGSFVVMALFNPSLLISIPPFDVDKLVGDVHCKQKTQFIPFNQRDLHKHVFHVQIFNLHYASPRLSMSRPYLLDRLQLHSQISRRNGDRRCGSYRDG